MAFLDKMPLAYLIIGALALGLAPFFPEPHLVEKTRMLINGTLTRPIDIGDLIMHATMPVLLILKLIRIALSGN
jgi:hypothetical protein